MAHHPDDFDQTIVALDADTVLNGRYRLVRELGRGGMGVVWLAADEHLDEREVAIKLLPAVLYRNARAVARLKKEALAGSELSHPHIVRLINFEIDASRGDLAFLVMQYVEGRTLDELLVDHPEGLPLERVVKWARQIGEALDFAHAKGVLHRDVKPSNIIVDGRDDAYLMDFSIACELRASITRVTGRDSSGTLPYMSPQQLKGENHASNDVYSFAATLYEAVSGQPPFVHGELAYQIQQVPARPTQRLPAIADNALLAGLAKDAVGRPSSAGALAAQLGSANPGIEAPAALTGIPAHETLTPHGLGGREAGDRWCLTLPKGGPLCLRYCPRGTFLMESTCGLPSHASRTSANWVGLSRGFWMSETPITQEQWTSICTSNPSDFKGPRLPVERVSWFDACTFCERLSERLGRLTRLPKEAEWEYGCTCANSAATCCTQQSGNNYAWHVDNSKGRTRQVARKACNCWGLFDMCGNVWEWCRDWYIYPVPAESRDPVGPAHGTYRVVRGGSWYDVPASCRCTKRNKYDPRDSLNSVGFRIVVPDDDPK